MDGLYGKPESLATERLQQDLTFIREELLEWFTSQTYMDAISGKSSKSLCELVTVADGFDCPITEGLFPLLEGRFPEQGNRIDSALLGRYYILTLILLGPRDHGFLEIIREMRQDWDGYPSPRGTGDY